MNRYKSPLLYAHLLVGVASCCAITALAQDKLPIPPAEAQQESLTLIKEVYGQEIRKATTPEQRQALATTLLQTAKALESSDDDANHYMLLHVAQILAAQARDAPLAFKAIEAMAAKYDVDAYRAYRLKVKALSGAAKSAVARLSLAVIDEAVDRDDFVVARFLGGLAVDAAQKHRNDALAEQIVERNREVEEVAEAFAESRYAQATLKIDPVDPDANLAVGTYYCFFKGNWNRGLPMLALGNDSDLKGLAVKELKGVSGSAEQMALGNGWWDLAAASEGVARKQLQGRAALWYRKALPGLSGLPKDRVEKRIQEALGLQQPGSQVAPPVPVAPSPPPRPKMVPALAFDGKNSFITGPHVAFDNMPVFTVEAWLMRWNEHLIDQGKPGDPENQFTIIRHPDRIELFWEHGRGANVHRNVALARPEGWEHLAVVLDERTLYVFSNGQRLHYEVGLPRPGPLIKERPMVIGANQITNRIAPSATGLLRSLRISRVARYRAPFSPEANWEPDDDTVLLWSASRTRGALLLDASNNNTPGKTHAVRLTRFRDDL